MRFRVTVDQDRCNGNTVCMSVAADVFELRDDDRAYVLVEEHDDDRLRDLQTAASMCPTQAIELVFGSGA